MPKCNYLYNHLSIVDESGYISPCCIFQRSNEKLEYPNIYNITDLDLSQILKSKKWTNLKTEMKNSDSLINECSNCKIAEFSNIESKRQHYNKKTTSNSIVLEDLEIALDYTCNMMCRMCDPKQSSKWKNSKTLLKELIKINPTEEKIYQKENNNNYKDKIKEIISSTDFSNLKRVNIVGGEPFYSKNLKYFLEKINNDAGIENIEISFNTNGSIFPQKDVLDLLIKAKSLLIRFSLDAIGELASVIRHGVDWSVINATVNKWSNYKDFKNINLIIHTTISVLNVNKLQEILDYSYKNDFDLNVYPLSYPSYLSIYQIPVNIRKRWLVTPTNSQDSSSIGTTDAINKILNLEYDFDGFKWCSGTNSNYNFDYNKFLLSMQEMNKYHNNSIELVNPTIIKIFEKLRKKNK
jgi:radical SAM protein with 4Fe4S-binding SPASM domain